MISHATEIFVHAIKQLFHFPILKDFVTAVIGIHFSNFGQPFCTLKILTLTLISISTPVLDSPPRDLCVYDIDVKIPTASVSNMTSEFYAWHSLAAKWLQISKIDRRILVALIEFHKGIYAVYAVSTMRRKYSHIKKRLKSLNWVWEYTGTKLTSTLFTIDGVVIVTPTHQYRLQPCVFNIYISGSLVWSKWERQKHVIQA